MTTDRKLRSNLLFLIVSVSLLIGSLGYVLFGDLSSAILAVLITAVITTLLVLHRLRSAGRADTRSAGEWASEGARLMSMEKDDAAIKCFDEALKLDPGDPEVWIMKGMTLYTRSERPYDAIIDCYEHALRLTPGNDNILEILNILRRQQVASDQKGRP